MSMTDVSAKRYFSMRYRCHTHPNWRKIAFTRERSKVRSLVRPPESLNKPATSSGMSDLTQTRTASREAGERTVDAC